MKTSLSKSLSHALMLPVLFGSLSYADIINLDDITVEEGHQTSLVGEAISSSEGLVTQSEIESRPVLRTGEILEFVPGMVVTQHSGSGKANQYFLRGFNLDHGTDFSTNIDGMPINMRTHGHGQGYTDLSFIIPEFIERIDYQKGPYHAEDGDFSAAGSANFSLMHTLDSSFVTVGVGENGYYRTVLGTDTKVGDNQLLFGLEAQSYDGPWSDISENVEKLNVLTRLSRPLMGGELTMTFMGYENSWDSADQIPAYAVKQGIIDELGSLDKSVGGKSSRYSLSTQWQNEHWDINAYMIKSDLNLYSNFTYYLDDPVNGDQFNQVDERMIYGTQIKRQFHGDFGNHAWHQDIGLQVRHDKIDEVALNKTKQRQYLSTVRKDSADVTSFGLFWEGELALSDALSFNLGARYDYMHVDVESNIAQNSGTADDGLFSLKSGLRYTFNDSWETYINAGQSFHSNDARGAVIGIDPVSGESVEPVDLLVRGQGAEIGLRFFDDQRLHISSSLWMLDLDSELLFVGDAGNTEASRASRRYGVELTAYYWLNKYLTADFEAAWTRARFKDDVEGEGNKVEGSLPFVLSAGIGWKPSERWESNIRLRHFANRVLDSFGEQESDAFNVVNFGLAYTFDNWKFNLDILNLFDSNDQDIAYYYPSRFSSQSAEIEDIHYHPIEPRTVRLEAKYSF
ncbi:MAG: Outer membrane receptor proteins, mostly Fe transport [uncultured Sulfurovum sp.]|uniref:Outer membrane receptor proteins, mostly Fe transport n=1 Tax=uncultured Sulfurovum sp. TaxID=269237 RepID=A0A6S6TC09_9BACT|nr:MAG: Outer membrane receptor proteins, mostly Fe transport [uncultured Sulfurovum sp.]